MFPVVQTANLNSIPRPDLSGEERLLEDPRGNVESVQLDLVRHVRSVDKSLKFFEKETITLFRQTVHNNYFFFCHAKDGN